MKKIVLDNEKQYNLYESTSDKYVIIVHGMVETYEGYFKLKDYLVENGFNVILYNQRGHGSDAHHFGHLNSGESYQLIGDLLIITFHLRKEIQASEVSVIGHSMGTAVVRSAMQILEYDKVILNGMPDSLSLLTGTIAKQFFSFGNLETKTELFDKMVFKSFNKKIENPSFDNSWICSNDEYMAMYNNDPYCGSICTRGYYREIIQTLMSANLISDTVEPTSLLLTTGSDDPTSKFGKVCDKAKRKYEKHGYSVTVKKYPKMRHFIYDEIGNEVCFEDVVQFLKTGEL